ncbi:FMN reductase [Streptomyces sp. Tu 6176]|uniref:NADPH-dependent FMN reductase n=1 Tax=Streptomyces sp. Tu 6176 TaxID=1470557 RepID=UPI000447DC11|nr:NAD(P)H-dependent oxidoreductase [Streptomyces sp. Tu 6176]EYT81895.1 FMN reductase [Streptomyces sp. Tu 6176]
MTFPQHRPRIVGLGGSPRPGSSAEQALRCVLEEARRLGADTRLIAGADLAVPLFDPTARIRPPGVFRLLSEVAEADGVVLASPAYHGSLSGLVKNALDYLEELRDEPRPYLSGRAVGCVAVGQGWQGAMTTLGALRDVVHALRGWPTPLGVAVNTAEGAFDADGVLVDPGLRDRLHLMAAEVVGFARRARAPRGPAGEPVGAGTWAGASHDV